MSSSSYAPSLISGSIRSSIIEKLKLRGYQVNPIQSDTNSTMTGIRGPGRIVGTLLSRSGRRLENAIDRFAEQQLGLGPNAAALRLASALYDIHANANTDCRSDSNTELKASLHPTDRLIWVCNGYCSRCRTAYLPHVLTELPEPALKAVTQLIKYLHSSQPPSNIGLASIFVRLLIQSRVLSVALVQKLDFLRVMQTTRETVWPPHSSHGISQENLVALKSTIAAIQETIERGPLNESNTLMRFGLQEVDHTQRSLALQLDQLNRISDGEWTLKEIAFTQLLTRLSAITWELTTDTEMSDFKRLLSLMSESQSSGEMLNHLVAQITNPSVQTVAALCSSTANSMEVAHGSVWSVAWSPDGTRIVSGSADFIVGVWDPQTGRQTARLAGHTDEVNCVTVSTDGAIFASGSDDRSVRLWDVETGASTVVLEGHTYYVYFVAFSPDGAQVASGSEDMTIRIWDTKTGLESRLLSGHTDSVNSLAFSSDGLRLASGSDDNTVRLWDVRAGRQIAVLIGHSHWVWSVAFSPDNVYIASGSVDRTIRLWDVRTRRETGRLNGHTDWVRSVAFAPDSKHLVSGSIDKTVRMWNVKTGAQIAVLRGHSNWVMSVAFSPDGNYVASGSEDRTIRMWDVNVLRAVSGGSSPPLHAQAEEVELGVIPEDRARG